MTVEWKKRFEETPDDDSSVWAYDGKIVMKERYMHGAFWYKCDDGEYDRDKNVTHWAVHEKPEPPNF